MISSYAIIWVYIWDLCLVYLYFFFIVTGAEGRSKRCHARTPRKRACTTLGAFWAYENVNESRVWDRASWLLRTFAVTRTERRAIAERGNPVAL